MEITYEELHNKTVAQLRKIAKELNDDSLKGYTTLHKHELLPKLCKSLGIEDHVHHEVVGIDKTTIKAKIRELKVKRDKFLEAKDRKKLKQVRREIHRLKRRIHKATV